MQKLTKSLQAMLLTGTMTLTMAAGAVDVFAAGTYSSTTGGENALAVSGETETFDGITVTKSGDSNDENADFTGTNAAILASDGATLTITNSKITTNGSHANAVFSYGTGTTVNISDSTITTSGNNSGGIMTTGGGTTNAEDLTVSTSGNSSAAIRSDRGGGDVNVDGGTYSTSGVGSPAVYSTADIDISNATLSSSASEGVVVEGANSVSLTGTDLTADNEEQNSDNTDIYKGVMIYQSMSGDADTGTASFSMSGGTYTNKKGSLFYVTNTTATIDLTGVTIKNNSDDVLLTVQQDGWGTSGSNGGNVTFTASNQTLTGSVTVDSVSYLNMTLKDSSSYTGAINSEGDAGTVIVTVEDGSTWTLTGDTYITGLVNNGSVNLNGHKLYVNGTEYSSVESDESYGDTTATSGSSSSDSSTDSDQNNSQNPGDQNGSQQPGDQNGSSSAPLTFTDVDSSSDYAPAVSWAVKSGITKGTTATTFSPGKGCTRAQIVTFLYRAAGSPAVSSTTTFSDVDEDSYYADAVAWAEQNGITSGTSETKFSPNRVCTRGQAVQLLYNYMKMNNNVSAVSGESTFEDVSEDDYYSTAVAWAAGSGVTEGTSATTFSPNDECTRAQIVTFLYRALASDDAAK